MNIGILIWDGVEPLDFIGPYEVFQVAAYLLKKKEEVNIYIMGIEKKPIDSQGLSINPHVLYNEAPPLDIILFPGGLSTSVYNREDLADWLRKRLDHAIFLLSVCTGIFMFTKLNLLDGLTVTTHLLAIKRLKKLAPKAIIDTTKRYHDNGKIITSAGVSAGIDMSLYVVSKIWGEKLTNQIAQLIEYNWRRE